MVSDLNPDINYQLAIDGKKAIEHLHSSSVLPDYIFLDINMPLMNGVEFLRAIKKIDRLKEIPVVVYSTSKERDRAIECLKLGAVDFLIKSPNLNKIKFDLRQYLG